MASSLDTSTPACPLYIHGVTVDFSKSKKNVESADVRINLVSPTPIKSKAGKVLRQTFSPPMKLSLRDTFALRVRYKKWHRMKNEYEDIVFEPDDIFRECDARERQEYNKVHNSITFAVQVSRDPTTEAEQHVSSSDGTLELLPTTDELFRKCPRFRILVIGKTGAGKSSLIKHAFGVQNAITSHHKPGEASIDHGFISPQNDRFVLHDSKGFEPGSKVSFEIVRDFIDRRRAMPDPKDQLHAVWLCFEIPCTGARLLETGVEQLLTSKRKGELGNIPIVVVFTKYDTLLDDTERTLDESSLKDLSEKAIKEHTKKIAEEKLQDVCIAPLERFAGSDMPHVTISTRKSHEETLALLIQTTEELVCKHVGIDASVMTSVAQRVDPGLKIKASIEVGKRKYWKALTSSATFKNRKSWDCLCVLHTDIVNVWNFHDPHRYLHSPEFREMMVKIVDKLEVGPTADPAKTLTIGLSMVGTIAGIVSALAGPAAPIVVPIAVGAVLAVWVHDVYQISHVVLQRFVSYIVHLTLVLQTLYLLSESQQLTRRAIKLAVRSYDESTLVGVVRGQIKEYEQQLTLLERADRDSLDQLVVTLLQLHSINAEQMSVLRREFPAMDLSLDEPWDTVEQS